MAKRQEFSSEPFGAAIERLMAESGTTYRVLAAKTELSAGYLNHLVHGNRPVPSNDVLRRVADAFDVDPEYFREHRLRVITERLEARPDLVDGLYRRRNTTLGDPTLALAPRGRDPGRAGTPSRSAAPGARVERNRALKKGSSPFRSAPTARFARSHFGAGTRPPWSG